MSIDQNGNTVSRKPRRELDGTWSSLVWSGAGTIANPATNIRRFGGYRSKADAMLADISRLGADCYVITD